MEYNCQNCRFWKKSKRHENSGLCVRNSPILIAKSPMDPEKKDKSDIIRNRAIWPATFYTDWCGEHEKK